MDEAGQVEKISIQTAQFDIPIDVTIRDQIARAATKIEPVWKMITAVVVGIGSVQATRIAMADLRQRYMESGFDPILDSNPDQARQFVKEEVTRRKPVIDMVGLTLD